MAHAGGRPTKYSKEYAERLPYLFREGMSIYEVAAELGISIDTYYAWKKKHKEFSEANKKGVALSQAWWEELGRQGAAGRTSINPATWIFNMKNRFKWTDRVEQDVKGGIQLIRVTDKEAEGLD
jgi:orotate phosphoribosyltransferase-like protein